MEPSTGRRFVVLEGTKKRYVDEAEFEFEEIMGKVAMRMRQLMGDEPMTKNEVKELMLSTVSHGGSDQSMNEFEDNKEKLMRMLGLTESEALHTLKCLEKKPKNTEGEGGGCSAGGNDDEEEDYGGFKCLSCGQCFSDPVKLQLHKAKCFI